MTGTVVHSPQEIAVIPQQLGTSDKTRERGRLVFDVGMNNGDDTAYYLSTGCEVVAIEANPILIDRARTRFRKEIIEGQLVVEGVGIRDYAGQARFWVNDQRSEFSSFNYKRARRNEMPCHPVDVECVTFDMLLKKHGIPHYLKLDVEGLESHCIQCLQSRRLPKYVSVEAEDLEFLLLLWQLGYRQFKIVDQMRHNSVFPNFSNEHALSRSVKHVCSLIDRIKNRLGEVEFPRGCSGTFGEATPGDWQSFEQTAYNWLHLHFGYGNRGTLNRRSWYDFHAKASTSAAGDSNNSN